MDEARKMIEDVREAAIIGEKNGGIDLSQYEEEFIDSVEDQLNADKILTGPQIDLLQGVWDRI